jgi:hypothetical protein
MFAATAEEAERQAEVKIREAEEKCKQAIVEMEQMFADAMQRLEGNRGV